MSSSTVATNKNIVGEDGPPADEQMPRMLTLVHLSSALSLSLHMPRVWTARADGFMQAICSWHFLLNGSISHAMRRLVVGKF